MSPIRAGQYVRVFDDSTRCIEEGIVRRVSPDGRIVYVQVEGDEDWLRYSPDEVDAS
jgi:hypothetical protein